MTLIIAGYGNNSIFFAADTAITSGELTLLCGFQKVYPVTVKLWKPYFIGEYFRDYSSVYMQAECVIAFSGSTLTAQHILNSISNHLGNLRISYESSGMNLQSGRYVIVMPCQRNELTDSSILCMWANDMFTSNDFKNLEGLLTADYIATIIEHSINHAVRSARKYKLDEKAFRSLLTDFASGIRCPLTGKFYLYVFRMQRRDGVDGTIQAYTSKELIVKERIAVLGLRDRFEASSQDQFDAVKSELKDIPNAMFRYLNEAIDIIQSEGSRSIARPSVLKIFDYRGLRTIDRRSQDE